jgi:hypothetical protein
VPVTYICRSSITSANKSAAVKTGRVSKKKKKKLTTSAKIKTDLFRDDSDATMSAGDGDDDNDETQVVFGVSHPKYV